MLTSAEVLSCVKAQPFRPFRIRMNSGKTYDVRHPEMVRVGKCEFLYFTFVSDSADVHDRWESVSLTLVESASFLETPVA